MALYHIYRPDSLDGVIGQNEAVLALKEKLKNKTLPQVILLTGMSGCGKTTIARILAKELGCHELDFMEINAAQARGIDTVRDVEARKWDATVGNCRCFLFDEAHQLTNPAQSGLLVTLEDVPKHVYFFLCTTNPTGILPTIRTRSTQIDLKPLAPKAMRVLIKSVVGKANLNVKDDDVIDRIIEVAEGSARMALNLLDKIMDVPPEDQLDLIQKSGIQASAYQIVQGLMWQKLDWAELAKLVESCQDDPETIRHAVLGAATKELLKGKNPNRANMIINEFRESWLSCGKAGLATSVYSVLQQK